VVDLKGGQILPTFTLIKCQTYGCKSLDLAPKLAEILAFHIYAPLWEFLDPPLTSSLLVITLSDQAHIKLT
jgi:hypothetical protein